MLNLNEIFLVFSYLFKVALIPVLILADYYLTIYTIRISKLAYSNRFKADELELNPSLRGDVNKYKMFNPRHLFITATITILVFFITLVELLFDNSLGYALLDILLGILLGIWFSIIARHLSNILVIRKINSNPDIVTGQLKISLEYMYFTSQIAALSLFIVLVSIMFMSFSYFIFGTCLGQLALMGAHSRWASRSKKEEK